MALNIPQPQNTELASAPFNGLFAPKVTTSERLFFTQQLALLLETGVSLHGALEALAQQSGKGALGDMLRKIAEDVSTGKPFSQALAAHPDVFTSSYVNLIGAAENGGFLHEVLDQLMELEEKREEMRQTLVSAASYPGFLLFFSIAVVLFILWVVFPKFGQMFVSIYDQLPNTTKSLMWLSDVLRYQWHFVLGGVVTTVLLLRTWLKSSSGGTAIDRMRLYAPGLRAIFVPVYLIQMLRTMGLSLNHGISVVDTLRGCKDIVNNRVVAQFLDNVEGAVTEGQPFAHAFTRGDFLPPLVTRMIVTGDETGNLGKVMIRVAQHYERELAARLDRASKVAEPLMLLIMGAMVGVIVSALILPIFKLTRAVG